MYLLRLTQSTHLKYCISKSKDKRDVIFLIVEFDFDHIDNRLIADVLCVFEKHGIPKAKYAKMNDVFYV